MITRRLEILITPDPDGVRCGGCEHAGTSREVHTGAPSDTCDLFGRELEWFGTDIWDDGLKRCQPCLDADRGEA